MAGVNPGDMDPKNDFNNRANQLAQLVASAISYEVGGNQNFPAEIDFELVSSVFRIQDGDPRVFFRQEDSILVCDTKPFFLSDPETRQQLGLLVLELADVLGLGIEYDSDRLCNPTSALPPAVEDMEPRDWVFYKVTDRSGDE